MMPTSQSEFIAEFAERTKKNYEKVKDGPYGTTALINSMVGLLIVPEQALYDKIVDSLISTQMMDSLRNGIVNNSYTGKIDLQFLCRHLRNSVAHSKFTFEAEKPNYKDRPLIIHYVVFEDEDSYGHRIAIKMSVSDLEVFLYSFSDAISGMNMADSSQNRSK